MSTHISEEIDNTMVRDSCELSENCQNTFSTRFFTKTVVKPGQGFLRPYLESVCVLDVSQTTDNYADNLDNCESLQKLQIPVGKNVELVLGSSETEAVRIVDKCVMTMRKGEESTFVLNLFGDGNLGMRRESSSVSLNITLHDFTEIKPTWSLDSDKKHELALLHKEKGTIFFKNGKTESAFCQYSVAIVYLICIPECTSVVDNKFKPEDKSNKEIYNALKCVCFLNLAACQMKVGNYNGVVNNCTHALSLDSANVKGMYRRAQANLARWRVNEARSDLNRALKIEPRNGAVAALLQTCKKI